MPQEMIPFISIVKALFWFLFAGAAITLIVLLFEGYKEFNHGNPTVINKLSKSIGVLLLSIALLGFVLFWLSNITPVPAEQALR